VGITVSYLAPAAAGATFAYSVERQADGKFFDFTLNTFRHSALVLTAARTRPLVPRDEFMDMAAEFAHVEDGATYIIRIHRTDRVTRIVAALPVTVWFAGDRVTTVEEGQLVEPSYRAGKKFFEGRTIEAKWRLTFYGDDGFTIHTATLWEDATSSCNCPRWCRKMQGQRRSCPHAERALTLTANVDETGAQPAVPSAPPPPVPPRQRSRPVDT
jgi:hypothetical protein